MLCIAELSVRSEVARERLLPVLERHGATLISFEYERETSKIALECPCGAPISKPYKDLISGNTLPRCSGCSQESFEKNARDRHRISQHKKISEACAAQGVTPLLDTYKNLHSKMAFICKCGCPFERSWANSSRRNLTLRCNSCNQLSNEVSPFKFNPVESLMGKGLYVNNRESTYWWYKAWIKAVESLYNKTCVISGQSTNTTCHHLNSFAKFPHQRPAIKNGVVLTKLLHNEFHSLYGRRYNTLEQFQEFYFKKTGKEFLLTKREILASIPPEWLVEKKKHYLEGFPKAQRAFIKAGKEHLFLRMDGQKGTLARYHAICESCSAEFNRQAYSLSGSFYECGPCRSGLKPTKTALFSPPLTPFTPKVFG